MNKDVSTSIARDVIERKLRVVDVARMYGTTPAVVRKCIEKYCTSRQRRGKGSRQWGSN